MASLLRNGLLRTAGIALVRPHRAAACIRNLSQETSPSATATEEKQITPFEEKVELAPLSGVPEEQLSTRKARIYVPARNAMQSGSAGTRQWKIEFNTTERWENPLMGWGSSADPLSNLAVTMSFDSKEDAMAYCDRNGWSWEVEEKREPRMQAKSYGANFSWDKKTRVSTK
ncbi:NDUFS4 [Branchiostoma lanceolatum]|uniref:NADH dehydrogenase [ubiquinone] iron-sulfur protein 4, mitochondrial n=1 Tax=Branchiostoma lanceolatum TaxID=7740 RepID=A0A8J9ZJN9_BRALA|nr:NDUFS4 [Branchiostoma lanceolatum]